MSDSQPPAPPGAPAPQPPQPARQPGYQSPPPGGYAPPPGGYAPPPPGGYAPQPVGGYQPQQPMPQPPVKKSHKGVWIALAIIVFLVGCCIVSFFGYAAYSVQQDRAAYQRAETVLGAAFKDVESSSAGMTADASDPTALAKSLQPKIAKAKQGVADARKDVASVSSSDKKTAYVKSLDEMDTALTKLDKVMTGMQDIGKLTTELTDVEALVKNADDAVGAGISAANNKRYGDAASAASDGQTQYAQAEATLAQMEKDWPGVGMAEAQQTVALKRSNADRLNQLAALGRAGSTATYNKVIDEYNGVLAQIRARPLPDFANDPTLLTTSLNKSIDDAVAQMTKAAADHDAAIKAALN
jgi:hypothetical protein